MQLDRGLKPHFVRQNSKVALLLTITRVGRLRCTCPPLCLRQHCGLIRGAAKKKNGFFWEISPKYGWVGWLTPKQGPNPSKPPQIAPKIAFFDPNFTFRSPKSHKNPGVGGWVNRFGRDLPKKTGFFFWQLPLLAPSGALVFIMVYYIPAAQRTHFFRFFKFFRF